ncbi:MAG TPA: hypothetical protein VF625_17725 [Longimicrobium sp.]|jgi:hypothetical protein
MYDAEISTMEQCRVRFEREHASGDSGARATAAEYLASLGAFVDAFNNGPGADAYRMGHDGTGTLKRVEDHVVWAEAERHRVRHAMDPQA